jgi:hypothetical protein
MNVAEELRKNWAEVRAQREGKAMSRARRLKSLDELAPEAVSDAQGPRPAHITNVVVKMHDETPMVFYDDGSLRRLQSKKLSRSLKKALKRKRHATQG